MWPSESDPFRSAPAAWNKLPGFPEVTGEQQVEMVRDFLFGLPRDAVFPRPGEEASSPLVRKLTPEEVQAAAEDAEQQKQKQQQGQGNQPPQGRRTGQRAVPGPARM
jgi:hypothetical protein